MWGWIDSTPLDYYFLIISYHPTYTVAQLTNIIITNNIMINDSAIVLNPVYSIGFVIISTNGINAPNRNIFPSINFLQFFIFF
nr:MAG TPA: hypothetical protein [Caudoviricetes sp.]